MMVNFSRAGGNRFCKLADGKFRVTCAGLADVIEQRVAQQRLFDDRNFGDRSTRAQRRIGIAYDQNSRRRDVTLTQLGDQFHSAH